MDENKSVIELKSPASEEDQQEMDFLNVGEDGTNEDNTEEGEEEGEDNEYEDWDTSCLEDEELSFEGEINEPRLKEILFLVFQTLLLLRPELKDSKLDVVFYSSVEVDSIDAYLCDYGTTPVIFELAGDLLLALILAADPVGHTYEYNDGPHDRPDGYSPCAEQIPYSFHELGDATARDILVSPGRLAVELRKEGFDLKQFNLGEALLAQGFDLEGHLA